MTPSSNSKREHDTGTFGQPENKGGVRTAVTIVIFSECKCILVQVSDMRVDLLDPVAGWSIEWIYPNWPSTILRLVHPDGMQYPG